MNETLDELVAQDPFEHVDNVDDGDERNAGWEEWEMDLLDRQYDDLCQEELPW